MGDLRGAWMVDHRNEYDHAAGTGSDTGGLNILDAYRRDQRGGDTAPVMTYQQFLVATAALMRQYAQSQFVADGGSAASALAWIGTTRRVHGYCLDVLHLHELH